MEKITFFIVGFAALFQKECSRFLRTAIQTLLSPLISVCLYLLIFGVNLADKIGNQNGVDYLQFIIPGLAALGLLNNAFQNASFSIINSKFHGDLQDLKVVPLVPSQIIWAYALAGAIRGLVISVAIIGVGELFYMAKYEHFLSIHNSFLLFVFLLAGGIIFGSLGLTVSLYSSSFDQMTAISTFIILPLIYLGGVFFSVTNLSSFWQSLSYLNPLLYLINGIRYAFLGVSDIDPTHSFLLTLIFVAGAYFLARLAIKQGSFTRF